MTKSFASFLVVVASFFFVFASPTSAKMMVNQNGNITVAKSEVVNDDLFIGGQNVVLDGTINGDVFVGGQVVKVDGVVNGNLHVGAMSIDIRGKVKGNVYAGAQTVVVTGSNIGGSLILGAATVSVDKNTTIGGSLITGTGALTVDSSIKRSLYAGTGSLIIGGNTKISKDLYYFADKSNDSANISKDAKISGSVQKTEFDSSKESVKLEESKEQMADAFTGVKIFFGLTTFFGSLLIGFLYLKTSPKHLAQSMDIVSKSIWKSLGVGFVTTISLIPGLIVLLITVIGIPLAGISLLFFMLFAALSTIVVAFAVGKVMSTRFRLKLSVYPSFVIGLLLISFLSLIPFVGFLVGLLVFWVGLGALILNLFATDR